jgi:hypothetical protein
MRDKEKETKIITTGKFADIKYRVFSVICGFVRCAYNKYFLKRYRHCLYK